MADSPAQPTTVHQAAIEAPAAQAERIARALEEALEPTPVATGVFDRGEGRFEVFAYYQEPPPRETLLRLIEQAGKDGVGPLRIEEIAPEDWVTLSQGKRGPVQAGRFVVHGSHDRGKVPRRRTTIEIDAGQAFGTAHHTSTRGCSARARRSSQAPAPEADRRYRHGHRHSRHRRRQGAARRPVLASDNDPDRGRDRRRQRAARTA